MKAENSNLWNADLAPTTPEQRTWRWYHFAALWVGMVMCIPSYTLAAGLIVTGGLHEDGFADACDGLGGTRPRERVLEIMRDSRIGTYGVLGLGMMLAAKVAALAALPMVAVPFVLIAGHTASRASVLWVMASSDYVREAGAAQAVAGQLDQRAMATGLVTTLAALLPLVFVLPVGAVLLGLLVLAAGHYAMRHRYERRLDGYTGDCLGAVQQCSELGFLLGVLAAV